jgi:hypothetical protein
VLSPIEPVAPRIAIFFIGQRPEREEILVQTMLGYQCDPKARHALEEYPTIFIAANAF